MRCKIQSTLIDERIYLEEPQKETDETVVRRHVARYRRAASTFRDLSPNRLLDIACGSGYGSTILSCQEYVGADRDESAVDYARSTYGHLGTFLCSDWSNLTDSEYDAIVSIETIEHLKRGQQPNFILRLCRLLEPNGILFLTCPISNKVQSGNPYHKYEPKFLELIGWLYTYFPEIQFRRELIKTTAGVYQTMGEFICRKKLSS